MKQTLTTTKYQSFQYAFDFFNRHLFGNTLPQVLITLQRKANSHGYFHAEVFASRADAKTYSHELAMNPETFGRTDKEILSTLVHEMAHVWQQANGTPSRNGYHNQEWVEKMLEIGLHPTDNGEIGGKQTGQKISHVIVAGGAYERAYEKLAADKFKLEWVSRVPDPKTRGAKAASKTKYTCTECDQNAWAKPGAMLLCGDCTDEDGNPVVLVAE
jgi:predicted SprT family Zn-dependent metalloprotease